MVDSETTSSDFEDDVRDYCRRRHIEHGNAYVSATQIVNEFDVTPQQAGATLAKLRDADDLEEWKNQSKSTSYRITVDSGGDRDE
ncbi:hypothetical protein [Halobacterium salinarum]|uniref:hypothetical protein n=1 Tax=Halobacterium salinarum TaxID=2242 RepID=UPI002552D629|nr:hypothetical protein [Halobacterium salinarum]MDL0133560.1 hypothetical protein [Halobacterium salinarum]